MQTHYSFFFFNDTATTEIYTLSLHDALPISFDLVVAQQRPPNVACDRRQDHLSSAPMVTVNADDQPRPLLGALLVGQHEFNEDNVSPTTACQTRHPLDCSKVPPARDQRVH